ncbi:MAG: ATP-grasp enzyme [Jatrophihabitans sp.]|uniref:ATP-grasp enzyme n=1 Tax=Jatrophihabitans sp. TaxID=1932789 RepID=UPI003F7E9C1B
MARGRASQQQRPNRLAMVPKTLGVQALLLAALPANAAVTALALARRAVVGAAPRAVADNPRTVLLSGGKMTKALQLARSFHRAGHRVVLVEAPKYRFTGHRFSNAVDAFHTVPPPTDPGYAQALLEIVVRERVDVYVPVCSPASSRYDALAKPLLEPHCEVLHCDADQIELLDDKYRFATTAASLGLPVPDTHLVTDPEQVAGFDFDDSAGHAGPYILKSIAYDPVHRLDLTELDGADTGFAAGRARSKPISEANPWILQEFVRGTEYCTHGTARDGELTVWCCCESSAFQLNYEMVDKPAIEEWVRTFVRELKLTGQVSFDFLETPDGQVRAIECNPRTHSAITMFYNHPGLAAAYLDEDAAPVVPLPDSRPTYWLYWELWRLLRHPRTVRERLRVIARGKDAIFDLDDPLPFLLVHHLQIPSLLLHNLRHLKDWIRVDVNIGKLVEPAGD